MPSLLLVMFILQLSLHIINTVGASTITDLLWILYNKLPTPTSSSSQRARKLRAEIIRLKRELSKVSPQDDFARWAKLDREHKKATDEYQKIDASLKTHQTTFQSTISTLRWLGTQGLRFLLQMWFAKQPMFWLPAGWVPYYVEWILSFPRAPLGSVSINVWGIACASMIALVGEALAATWVLVTHKPVPTKGDPMAYEATTENRTAGEKGTPREEKARQGLKKEL